MNGLFLMAAAVGTALLLGCLTSDAATGTTNNLVTVRLLDSKGELLPPTQTPKVVKSDAEWKKQLTPEQFKIGRGRGTEAAFCGVFYDHKKPGLYSCVCCDLPLFSASAKFD